ITTRVTSKKGTRKPISGGSEVFVPDSTGTSGTNGREVDAKEPADPQTNQIMTRVTREK
ncbi:hypothetical protein KI387_036878, partial [Taxus chinensis]